MRSGCGGRGREDTARSPAGSGIMPADTTIGA